MVLFVVVVVVVVVVSGKWLFVVLTRVSVSAVLPWSVLSDLLSSENLYLFVLLFFPFFSPRNAFLQPRHSPAGLDTALLPERVASSLKAFCRLHFDTEGPPYSAGIEPRCDLPITGPALYR